MRLLPACAVRERGITALSPPLPRLMPFLQQGSRWPCAEHSSMGDGRGKLSQGQRWRWHFIYTPGSLQGVTVLRWSLEHFADCAALRSIEAEAAFTAKASLLNCGPRASHQFPKTLLPLSRDLSGSAAGGQCWRKASFPSFFSSSLQCLLTAHLW